jgi:hypothetical protein
MDAFDIFMYIKNHTGTYEEMATEINNTLLELENPTNIRNKLNSLWEDCCSEESLCENCGEYLETKVTKNESVEYQGQVVNEPIYIKYCPNCG